MLSIDRQQLEPHHISICCSVDIQEQNNYSPSSYEELAPNNCCVWLRVKIFSVESVQPQAAPALVASWESGKSLSVLPSTAWHPSSYNFAHNNSMPYVHTTTAYAYVNSMPYVSTQRPSSVTEFACGMQNPFLLKAFRPKNQSFI